MGVSERGTESGETEKRYGMRLNDLNESLLVDVFTIYDEVSDSEYAREHIKKRAKGDIDYINDIFEFGNAAEWRLGSKFSRDTKLYVWKAGYMNEDRIIRFSFDTNSAVSDPKGERRDEALKLEKSFKDRIEQYLLEKGLAVPLTRGVMA